MQAFPLHWPAGWARTKRPDASRFDVSFTAARDGLFEELARMGARNIVLSTNIPLRRDGLPYAAQREPDDSGAAVYFLWNGKQMTFACDRWNKVKDNIRAIQKTVEALRGIKRWGATDMMERAFTAFEALPPPSGSTVISCWDILGIEPTSNTASIKAAWRRRMKSAHPDHGGTLDEYHQVQKAYKDAVS